MTILSILGHFGANLYSQIELNFEIFLSSVLIWISHFQNGLIDFFMNIFSDLIWYFVKMVIFIEK